MEFKETLLVHRVRTKKAKIQRQMLYRYLEIKRKLGTCYIRGVTY